MISNYKKFAERNIILEYMYHYFTRNRKSRGIKKITKQPEKVLVYCATSSEICI